MSQLADIALLSVFVLALGFSAYRNPLRNLLAWQHISLIPDGALRGSLELFSTKVLPRFS